MYWVLDGYFDMWNRWALRQVNALHAAGRMFQERDHVHTLLYNFEWEYRRDPDGVPVELALDHPYRGFVTVFIDRAEGGLQRGAVDLAAHGAPARAAAGSDADLVAAFTPIALEVDAPGDVPREKARDNRTVLLWFLNTPPEVAWEPVIAEHRRRLEEAGKGTVSPPSRSSRPSRAPTPTPTSSGDGLTDCGEASRCRGASPRARISTWVTTKTASSEAAQRRKRLGDAFELVGRSGRTRGPARRGARSAPGRPTARPTTPSPRGRRRSTSSSTLTSGEPGLVRVAGSRGPIGHRGRCGP